MRIATFFFIVYMVNISWALQAQHRITATITNAQQLGLNGTLFLYNTDTNFIASQSFEKGFAEIVSEDTGQVILKISSLGYEDQLHPLFIAQAHHELGSLQMIASAHIMRDVKVTHQRPLFETGNDGMRVNVENSLLSKSINAAELLSRVPTVNINGNKVTVLGRGQAIIILQGKETTFESFKSLAPSDIKTIEVLTNPDARYDAKGKAVILITLKRHAAQGLQATLVEALTVGMVPKKSWSRYWLNAPNLTLNLRKNKWDIATYYANEKGTNWMENQFVTTVKATEGNYTKTGYYTEDNHNRGVHYYRLGIGYTPNDRSALSVQYDGLAHYFTLDVKQDGDYLTPSQKLTRIRMTNDASTRLVNHSMNLNFHHKLDTLGSNWFVGAQFNRFQNKLLDRITERITDEITDQVSQRKNDGLNVIHLYTVQTDLTKKRAASSVDIGAKFSYNRNEGRIHFYSKQASESDYTENPLLANATLYSEMVPALYVVYKTSYKKLNASLGLRWEHTFAKGISKKYNTTIIDASYSNIFPSAKFQYTLTDAWKLGTSFTYKINRPLYQDLDPFLWYLDSLTSIQGNSNLVPEYIQQQEITLAYHAFTLRYGLSLSNNTIASVMKPGVNGVNAVVFTKDNIEHRRTHTLALDLPFEKKNYSSFTTFAVNAFRFKDYRPMYTTLSSQAQFYVYTYHAYKIPSWCTAEFTAEYYSRSSDGFTRRKPYYYFTLAVSRSFLKNEALQVNVMWNDMARTAVWVGVFQVNTYGNDYNQRVTSHYVRLTATYTLSSKIASQYRNKNIN
ncbi:MAG TPA: outer membrane beta-barrel family protein [Chitinophagaceae bacterium]|nr:outer membrane beta-barrel family protein [Chitinophagaceae bacterium]